MALSMVVNHKRNDHIKRANKTTIYEFLTIQLSIQSFYSIAYVLLLLLQSVFTSSTVEPLTFVFVLVMPQKSFSQVGNASLITTTKTKYDFWFA